MFRTRRILIALTFAILAGLVIRLRGRTPTNHEIKTHDKIVEEVYQAPFSNPNAYLEDWTPIILDAYVVHLAPGHSIEKHSSSIKTDITSHIDRILDTKSKIETTYVGQNISSSLLTAIRSDPQVTLLEYATGPLPIGGFTPAHQAPLSGCDAPRAEIEPKSFQVLLAPDYPFEDHFAVVGQDIEPYVRNKYNFHTNKWVYSVKPVDLQLLKAIRSDRNVELVVCESRKKRQTEGDLRPKREL
jgi:hypothetical protein